MVPVCSGFVAVEIYVLEASVVDEALHHSCPPAVLRQMKAQVGSLDFVRGLPHPTTRLVFSFALELPVDMDDGVPSTLTNLVSKA